MAGGGAGGDAPDAQASALGLPHGQPQPPKRLSPSWDTTNHVGVQREVSSKVKPEALPVFRGVGWPRVNLTPGVTYSCGRNPASPAP